MDPLLQYISFFLICDFCCRILCCSCCCVWGAQTHFPAHNPCPQTQMWTLKQPRATQPRPCDTHRKLTQVKTPQPACSLKRGSTLTGWIRTMWRAGSLPCPLLFTIEEWTSERTGWRDTHVRHYITTCGCTAAISAGQGSQVLQPEIQIMSKQRDPGRKIY